MYDNVFDDLDTTPGVCLSVRGMQRMPRDVHHKHTQTHIDRYIDADHSIQTRCNICIHACIHTCFTRAYTLTYVHPNPCLCTFAYMHIQPHILTHINETHAHIHSRIHGYTHRNRNACTLPLNHTPHTRNTHIRHIFCLLASIYIHDVISTLLSVG